MSTFILVMAQINPVVGDVDGNTQKIIEAALRARDQNGAQLVLFPELCLTGYPPEDLLLRPSLAKRVERALSHLCEAIADTTVVLGYPRWRDGSLFNAAGVLKDGHLVCEYFKQCLPNYQVFDEKRYFDKGHDVPVFNWHGHTLAINICEDIWEDAPLEQAKANGAQLILNLNASPFDKHKQAEREQLVCEKAQSLAVPIVYTNMVGGQDELVFDGGSFAVNAQGKVCTRAPNFEEGLFPVHLSSNDHNSSDDHNSDGSHKLCIELGSLCEPQAVVDNVYKALVLGVRDYVNKNRFPSVVLGLSGGIDSALTLAVAVDALGADRVEAVMMPFKYTSQLSKDDAADQAERMGVSYHSIGIESIYQQFSAALAPIFEGYKQDTTEENMQARSRGVLLMAISNKKGSLVLTTGNKSELAVGYATLYGDMAGGFDVLKDIPKTLVYELSKYRNRISEVIPNSVITRPPSAELAPDQIDQDSLPDYDVLDAILELYIERDMSAEAITNEGYDKQEVYRVLRMVDVNEYKRRQAAIGVRISQRGFGRDRRYPITNAWALGD